MNISDITNLLFPFNIMVSIVFIFSAVVICIHESALCDTRKADMSFRKEKDLRAIKKIFGKPDSSNSTHVFYIIFIFNFFSFFALLWVINYLIQK